ncbi:GNAT family N-acetyltransferase [Curtobacterium sp. C1]|uniref:GNAT family N-acetyltransferase n=1 Tax=Curtobacterium TaxID=2034 RepID=UPI001E61745C|nr:MULTISPECIES: GNAT family protein [Curtobacterium]MCS5486017.1 GNAT family N-acetyltransferase [Curtobacterium flaccumfaciens pv. basellae]UFU14270.1 GNAT family N-acetyltransferase [Curtobacterium sp. C1]WIJ45602.1 GNAT family protein [Curtobacterium citreum]
MRSVTAPSVTLLPVDLAHPVGRSWLVAFLTTNRFPFHVTSAPTRNGVERRVADGDFSGPAHALFRVEADGAAVGMVALDDLDDGAPLIDVRLAERARGRGLGVPVVRALAGTVFAGYPDVDRLEAQTRDDNVAMRKVLVRCGWVQEAQYRRAWPVEGSAPRDSVAYGLLREDHRSGRVTPFLGRFDAGE